jgi:hypothetical protein
MLTWTLLRSRRIEPSRVSMMVPRTAKTPDTRSSSWSGQSTPTGYRIVLSTILLFLLTAPSAPVEFTYKEYAKAPEAWKRGYVFAISRYMSVVAQPDEEPPYPLREAFQRCLASATDSILIRQVDSYVAANRASSQGAMVTVVVRALFDLCRSEIEKVPAPSRKILR